MPLFVPLIRQAQLRQKSDKSNFFLKGKKQETSFEASWQSPIPQLNAYNQADWGSNKWSIPHKINISFLKQWQEEALLRLVERCLLTPFCPVFCMFAFLRGYRFLSILQYRMLHEIFHIDSKSNSTYLGPWMIVVTKFPG